MAERQALMVDTLKSERAADVARAEEQQRLTPAEAQALVQAHQAQLAEMRDQTQRARACGRPRPPSRSPSQHL